MGIYLDEDEFDEELGIDSFTFISLVVAVEEEFNISIPDEKLSFESLGTFSKMLDCVSSLA